MITNGAETGDHKESWDSCLAILMTLLRCPFHLISTVGVFIGKCIASLLGIDAHTHTRTHFQVLCG